MSKRSVLFVFLRCLLGLLPLADLGERGLVGTVSNRARYVVPELSGGFASPIEFDSLCLAQNGDEDLRLLVAEAGQGWESLQHDAGVDDT